MVESILLWAGGVVLAPLFSALILKVKAWFGGKKGPPLLINYYTLAKLLKKGSVYSRSTSFVFKFGPPVILGTVFLAVLFLPVAGRAPLLSFNGDIIFILYLFGLGRFFMILAAMDTASPFEGMGAAREAFFSIIGEASSFLILILLFLQTGELSLRSFFAEGHSLSLWKTAGSPMVLAAASLFVVLLTENARVPVDDPATHLELTMIHEVMVLDHSGPDFALLELARFLKLFFYSALAAAIICPVYTGSLAIDGACFAAALISVYLLVGIVESILARYRMDKVPQFVLSSLALAFFAIIIEFVK